PASSSLAMGRSPHRHACVPSEAPPGDGADEPSDGTDGNAPGPAQELAMGESAALNDNWMVSIDAVMDATEDLLANQNPEPPRGDRLRDGVTHGDEHG